MLRRIAPASRWLLFTAAFLLPAFLGSQAQARSRGQSLVNRAAPGFTRTSLSGKTIDLEHLRGNVVLLNFWATWCAPCQAEMPAFSQWQSAYGPQGLQVIGISMDDDVAPARKLVARMHLSYPVAMGDARLGRLYGGVLGLPLSFLIDRRGVVRARYQGETNLAVIEQELKILLAGR